jgi:hypothetical protein
VNIAHRARHFTHRYLQNLDKPGGVHVAGSANLNAGIPALRDERRQPTDLELQSDKDQQIGVLEFKEETRFRFDEVRILGPRPA